MNGQRQPSARAEREPDDVGALALLLGGLVMGVFLLFSAALLLRWIRAEVAVGGALAAAACYFAILFWSGRPS
jgi:hypothetical protein